MAYRDELIGLTNDSTHNRRTHNTGPRRHTDPRRNALVKRKPSAGERNSNHSAPMMVAVNPLPRTVRVILGGAQNHDTERGNPQRHRARPVIPGNLFGRDLAQVAHAGATINFGIRV